MPFQPINFAGLPVQNTQGDLVQGLISKLTGIGQLGQIPGQMEERELANAFKRLQVQQEPQRFQSAQQSEQFKNALMQSKAEKLQREANSPFAEYGGLPAGEGGQALLMDAIKKKAEENPEQYGQLYQDLKQRHEADLENKKILNKLREGYAENTKYKPFSLLPANERQRQIAITSGLGYEPLEAIKLLNTGHTLQDLADAKGKSLENNKPDYAPTGAVLTDLQKRVANTAELNTISKLISPHLAKVAQKFGKTSPALYGKMLGNYLIETKDGTDEIGQILASHALQYEQSAGRLRTLGARVGIEGIREVTEKMLSDMNVPKYLLTPEIIAAMNKYSDEYITKGVNAYEDAVLGKGKSKQKPSSESVKIFDPKTNKIHMIPLDKADAAMKAGGQIRE